VRRVRAVGASLSSGWLSQASDTPLNGEPGTNRVFGTLDTDLDTIKSIKNALGGSVNDVVLAAVAGGVRSFLRGSDFDVSGIDFRVMAPVSVRSLSDRGTMGNQVAMWLASLPVGEPDPVARLEAVKRETMKLKTTDQALGAATLVSLSAGAPATLVSLASRLASGARPFNMTVTNVPGPQVPLYFLGAELVAQYPLVPLWHGHGIGVALFSYNGSVAWGFNSAYDVVPDVDGFAAAVEASIRELAAAAAGPPRATRASRPKRRPPLEHAKSP
jgi:WS/DGAT/MGAT family acyltransferase